MCADFVRENTTVADIGTDHCFLPAWLVLQKHITRAIAADINPQPLKSAAQTVAQFGLQTQIELRQSNGLESIAPHEAEDIVIAGMGGELIFEILNACPWAKDNRLSFILQPMSKSEVLVRESYREGYEITEQKTCIDRKKPYTAFLVKYSGNVQDPAPEFCYKTLLNPKTNPTDKAFFEQMLRYVANKAKGSKEFEGILGKLLDENN
jgi:tRNA (adenine22-N1)-methyltransferase